MGKKWSMHGKGMDHFGKENWDSRLVIGEREEERKEKLTRKGRWSVSEWDWVEKENGGLKEKEKCTIKGGFVAAHKETLTNTHPERK